MKILRSLGIFLLLALCSCGTQKKYAAADNKARKAPATELTAHGAADTDKTYQLITSHAREFLGTPYKYGGVSRSGMDCSGLIYISFLEANIPLPRSARHMAETGTKLHLSEVNIGDLLFFETDKRKSSINHVGLVVEKREEKIKFIHSSTSRGVIISDLDEHYWREHFVMARRMK